MGMNSGLRFEADRGDATRSLRTGLAFLALAIGVAGSLSAVPLAIWGLAARGFQ